MPAKPPVIGQLPNPDFFTLKFAYNAAYVRRVRSLENRRWNKEVSCWEVHISHLGEVMEIFNLQKEHVDAKLMRTFHMHRLKCNRGAAIEVGSVRAQLQGDNLPLQSLDDALSFFVPGYQFMPKYLQGIWDGRRHLYDRRRGMFPAGLTNRVNTLLTSKGVTVKLTEQESQKWTPLKTNPLPFKLRDYQKECLEAAIDGKRGVLEIATGGGKTAVAAAIIRELKAPALFFVHTKDLLYQAREALAEALGIEIGQAGDGIIDIKPVTVATIQTCARALNVKFEEPQEEPLEEDETDVTDTRQALVDAIHNVPLVFFDECHHLPADGFYGVAMATESAWYRFGLSATPYRADHQDLMLEAALGPKIYRANASVLINKGHLVAPMVQMHAAPAVKVTGRATEYQKIFETCVVTNTERNKLIGKHAQALAKQNKSVLILVNQVKHGELLQRLIKGAPLLQGRDATAVRKKTLKDFEKRKTPILIATTLADEGLDIPSLDAVIIASGGLSETRTLQRIGRALRKAPGKSEAVIVDFFDNAPHLKDHSLRRLDIYRNEPAFHVETVGFKA